MPFASKAQARLMFAIHPGIARRWVNESGRKHPIKRLPEHVAPKKHPTLAQRGH